MEPRWKWSGPWLVGDGGLLRADVVRPDGSADVLGSFGDKAVAGKEIDEGWEGFRSSFKQFSDFVSILEVGEDLEFLKSDPAKTDAIQTLFTCHEPPIPPTLPSNFTSNGIANTIKLLPRVWGQIIEINAHPAVT